MHQNISSYQLTKSPSIDIDHPLGIAIRYQSPTNTSLIVNIQFDRQMATNITFHPGMMIQKVDFAVP
jgi:hypothetical protein